MTKLFGGLTALFAVVAIALCAFGAWGPAALVLLFATPLAVRWYGESVHWEVRR